MSVTRCASNHARRRSTTRRPMPWRRRSGRVKTSWIHPRRRARNGRGRSWIRPRAKATARSSSSPSITHVSGRSIVSCRNSAYSRAAPRSTASAGSRSPWNSASASQRGRMRGISLVFAGRISRSGVIGGPRRVIPPARTRSCRRAPRAKRSCPPSVEYGTPLMPELSPYILAALRAACEAGRIQRRLFGRLARVDYKGWHDPVTEADRASEEAIVEVLRGAFPDHAFLGEEGGRRGEAAYTWLIDPLDGTHNYARALPWFAVSIALCH